MTGGQPFGAPFSLRRLVWSVLLILILLLVIRCSWQNAAQLQQYTHPHHHHPAVAQ